MYKKTKTLGFAHAFMIVVIRKCVKLRSAFLFKDKQEGETGANLQNSQ